MSVTIRYADRSDDKLIADISQRTFYETFAPDNSEADMNKFLSEQFTIGKLMLEVGAPGNTFLLAHYDGQVAGYAKLRTGKIPPELPSNNSLEIARLYAMPGYIGKGIGAALMKRCIELALEDHKDTIWLGVWERNQRAIDFYHKWGFQKFGIADFLLGNDLQTDWMMYKDLRQK